MNRAIDNPVSVIHKQSGDQDFCTDPGRSFTLPARFYHDPEIYELEKKAIFFDSWLWMLPIF